jgi:DNA-binding NarL/FixJ family response regulator
MRLVVIDDHAQFAEMVRDTIGREPDFESVHHATNLADGLDLIARTLPDLVALNVHIGPRDGLSAVVQITERHPTVRVVVLTAFASEPMMQRAESAKASALHPKNAGPARLLWVLRNTGPEGFTVHPEVLHQLKAGGPQSPRADSRRPTQPPTFSG